MEEGPAMNSLTDRRKHYTDQIAELDEHIDLMKRGVVKSSSRKPGTELIDTTAETLQLFERQKKMLEDVIADIDERLE
jgi:hypothetical protein